MKWSYETKIRSIFNPAFENAELGSLLKYTIARVKHLNLLQRTWTFRVRPCLGAISSLKTWKLWHRIYHCLSWPHFPKLTPYIVSTVYQGPYFPRSKWIPVQVAWLLAFQKQRITQILSSKHLSAKKAKFYTLRITSSLASRPVTFSNTVSIILQAEPSSEKLFKHCSWHPCSWRLVQTLLMTSLLVASCLFSNTPPPALVTQVCFL